MILVARALVRLLAVLLPAAVAVAGLVLALFCIGTGTSGPSLGGLAELARLADLRDTVAAWLDRLEAPGPVALVAALCGLGAVLLGLLLLLGVLVPRRERLVTLSTDERGRLAARRRPLGQAAESLVEQARGITEAKVRVRPGRRAGGSLSVHAARPRPVAAADARSAVHAQLSDLIDPFELKARVDVSRRGSRVQ